MNLTQRARRNAVEELSLAARGRLRREIGFKQTEKGLRRLLTVVYSYRSKFSFSCEKHVTRPAGTHLRGDRFYGEVVKFKAANADGPLGDRTLPGADVVPRVYWPCK